MDTDDETIDAKTKLESVLAATTRPQLLEIEARFGLYTHHGFYSNIQAVHYIRLRDILDSMSLPKTVQRYKDTKFEGDIRKRVVDDSKVIWEHKKQLIDPIDDSSLGIRISVNTEYLIRAPSPTVTLPRVTYEREMHRTSYRLDEYDIEISLSKVRTNKAKGVKDTIEIELEILKPVNSEKVDKLMLAIPYIFKLLYGTDNIFSSTLKAKTSLSVNHNAIMADRSIVDKKGIVIQASDQYIDRRILTEARSITRRDVDSGAFVKSNWYGEKGVMTCTQKTDGLRYMYVASHELGVWIINTPFNYNLLIHPKDLTGTLDLTVFDCELIPEDKRIYENGAPRTKYWLQIVDCMFVNGNSVENNTFTDRLVLASAFKEELLDRGYIPDTLTITDKGETRSWDTADEFFSVVSYMLSKVPTLSYKTDGLMFIPVNYKYMMYNTDLHPKQRVLKSIPDIIKWKPPHMLTIDFRILRTPDGVRLGSEAKRDNINVSSTTIFQGKGNWRFDYDTMLIKSHPLTDDLPDGSIVEYAWKFDSEPTTEDDVDLPEGNYLYPIRLRLEKSGPNSISVAEDIWSSIMDPITEDEISGTGVNLMVKYHNKIKNELFRETAVKRPGDGSILDLASGYGGDVFKIKYAGYSKLILVEPDEDIDMTVDYDTKKSKTQEIESRLAKAGYNKSQYSILNTRAQDTERIRDEVMRLTNGEGVDTISLMLCLTFFWDTADNIQALANTINACLKPGGKIIWLTLDGTRVEQLVEPKFGGLRMDRVEFGPVIIEVERETNPDYVQGDQDDVETYPTGKLITTFPGIVGKQIEYMVETNDLLDLLNDVSEDKKEIASGQDFMPEHARELSKLYTYGIWTKKISQTQTRELNTMFGNSMFGSSLLQPRFSPSSNDPPKLPSKVMITEGGVSRFEDVMFDLVKVRAIGDGSCLIHSFLLSLSEDYRKYNDSEKRDMAANIRRNMADWLISPDTEGVGINWETAARGSYLEVYLHQLNTLCSKSNVNRGDNKIDEGLDLAYGIDHSPSSLFSLINSYAMLGIEGVKILSEMFDVDIYVLSDEDGHLNTIAHSSINQKKRPSVITLFKGAHFDAVGLMDEKGQVTTVFKAGNSETQHPLLTRIRKLFRLDPYNDEAPNIRDTGKLDLESIYTEFFTQFFSSPESEPELLYRSLEKCKPGKLDSYRFPQPVNDWVWKLNTKLKNQGLGNGYLPLEHYIRETLLTFNDIKLSTQYTDDQKRELLRLVLEKNCLYISVMSQEKDIKSVYLVHIDAQNICEGLKDNLGENAHLPFGIQVAQLCRDLILNYTSGNPTGSLLYAKDVLESYILVSNNGALAVASQRVDTGKVEIWNYIIAQM